MLDLYVNVKNSLKGLIQALRISISNANNFNTPGYKYTFASFTTVYSEAMSSGTRTQNPMHVGSAMTMGSTSTDFSQGNLSIGTSMDTAIVGEGFFILSQNAFEFAKGADKVYTRAGRFQTDSSNKYITDSFGRKVYGFKVDANGNAINNELVPLETNGEQDLGFLEGGILASNFSLAKNDTAVQAKPMYRLALTTFQNKQGLVPASGGAYTPTVSSGEQLSVNVSEGAIGSNASGSYGNIVGETLESANVDIAKVALDMNLLNRGFSAVQAVIDDIGKIVNQLISKIIG